MGSDTSPRKEVTLVISIADALTLMISFASLVVAIITVSFSNRKK
ncbi:putative holin-like toxin [Bacillus massilinigeriensis]|nr:putative holin-like toxin [Bacillus mediterraneensis]